MNLRDLKYLVALDEYKSFRKAADAAFVSQPTLSMQIKKLEEFLQVQLIERNNNNILLTRAGKEILEQAKIILDHEKNIINIAKSYTNPNSGEIKIGAFPTLAPYYFPNVMPVLMKKFPELKVYLVEEKTDILISMLKEGKIDFAFLALPIKEPEFETIEIFEENFYLAVPKKHKFAKKESVSIKDLENENLLLLEEGHCLREQTIKFCQLAGADEHKEFRATSMETLRQMVLAGVGITLMPKIAQKDDGLKYIPLKEGDSAFRSIALVYRKNSHREGLFKNISKSLKN